MQGKITKQTVDSFQPGTRQLYLWDTQLKGFGLRVNTGGSKVYILKYQINRRPRWYKIGEHGTFTPAQARIKARELLGQVARNIDPATSRDESKSALTLNDFAPIYLERHARIHKKRKSISDDERYLKKLILPALGRHTLDNISRRDIAGLHQKLSETQTQANRVLALLSVMFKLAHNWGFRKNAENPCAQVKKYKEKPRERFLNDDELETLTKVLRDCEEQGSEMQSAITAIRLLLFTGARCNEILQAKWEDADLTKGYLQLHDSKTGARRIPLAKPAIQILENTNSDKFSHYICPGAKPGHHLVGIQKIWQRIRTKAGIPDVRLHDLRHTYASIGASNGMSLSFLGKLLGHKNQATTQRYAHLFDEPIQKAAADIASIIHSKGTPNQPEVPAETTSDEEYDLAQQEALLNFWLTEIQEAESGNSNIKPKEKTNYAKGIMRISGLWLAHQRPLPGPIQTYLAQCMQSAHDNSYKNLNTAFGITGRRGEATLHRNFLMLAVYEKLTKDAHYSENEAYEEIQRMVISGELGDKTEDLSFESVERLIKQTRAMKNQNIGKIRHHLSLVHSSSDPKQAQG